MIAVDISLDHIDLVKLFTGDFNPRMDEIEPALVDWLKENYPNQYELVIEREITCTDGEKGMLLSHAVIFKEEKPAMHFKLVWGGIYNDF